MIIRSKRHLTFAHFIARMEIGWADLQPTVEMLKTGVAACGVSGSTTQNCLVSLFFCKEPKEWLSSLLIETFAVPSMCIALARRQDFQSS